MKHLKEQKVFNSSETNLITENINIIKYNKYYNQIMKELNVNFYFVATFGTSIAVFYPIFDELVKNSQLSYTVTTKDIVLLSVTALAVLFKENKQYIGKMKTIIEENSLSELLDKFISFLTNVNNLFKGIAKNTGQVVVSIIDMFSYTALYVPFYLGLLDLIELYNIGVDTFTSTLSVSGLIITTSIGVLTITLKHFVSMLMKKIKRLTKSKQIKESLDLDTIIELI